MPKRTKSDSEGVDLLAGPFLRAVHLDRKDVKNWKVYPFNLPVVKGFHSLQFHPKVTFLVGENGSGKSTMIEAIAVAAGFNPEGGSKGFNFATRKSHSSLNEYLTLQTGGRVPKDGYYLRAESFFNVGTEIENLDREPSSAPPLIWSYGGISLHEQSHGESFMALVLNRFRGSGVYILDEPESALSPSRQIALLTSIHQLVNKKQSQFIISTHSPILMAYPDADIYKLDSDGMNKVSYKETEHYCVTREFLMNTDHYLNVIMSE